MGHENVRHATLLFCAEGVNVRTTGAGEKEETMSVLRVGQKKPYRIQKDAMAEFGYDLKFTMRGAHQLNDGVIVWFPNLVKSELDEFPTEFGNILKNDGKTLVEIAPNDKMLQKVLNGSSLLRIAFGRYRGEKYKFLGVFKYDHVDKSRRQVAYKRIAAEIKTDDCPVSKR